MDEAQRRRYLDRLAFLWGLYYVLFSTLSRYETYQWVTLWVGGPVCVGITVLVAVRCGRISLSREAKLFALFFAWCLLGLTHVVDLPGYTRSLKLVAEGVVVVACVSYVIGLGGRIAWFYAAFLAAALLSGVLGMFDSGLSFSLDPDDMQRMEGLTQSCAMGFTQVLGVIGALGLWCESRWRRWRPLLVAASLVCLAFLTASGSRGAYVLILVVIPMWSWLCFRPQGRKSALRFVALIVFLLGLGLGTTVVWKNTYLGLRFQTYMNLFQKGEEEKRVTLAREAFRVFLDNPVLGVGLNQFRYISFLGTEAHNDVGELLSTTGLVGLGLMLGVYLGPWRHLDPALRLGPKGDLFYRINHARVVMVLVLLSMFLRSHITQFDSACLIGMASGVGELAHRWVRYKAHGMPAQPIRRSQRRGGPIGVRSARSPRASFLASGYESR